MTAPRTLRHARAASVGAALFLTGLSQPASALQQIQLKELTSTSKLFDGNSDLAELDRATNGAIGRKLVDLFNAPLPLQTKAVVNQAAGSPMLSQALMLLSSLGGVEGLPGNLIDEKISRALDSAAAKGPLTMLTVLPGVVGPDGLGGPESGPVSGAAAGRTARAGGHPAGGPAPVSVDATLSQPCPLMVQRRETKIPVTYRYAALRLVLISHGLWDSPARFEGWGRHLASHGSPCCCRTTQAATRASSSWPCSRAKCPLGPAELRLRPLDISALTDAAAAGKLGLPPRLPTDSAVVLGQSWGATTVLQLPGAQPSSVLLL